MKGSRPPPGSSFSLTMISEDQAVMFGGINPSGRSSKAHILHLPTMVSYLCGRILINIEYNVLKLCQLYNC